jgi:pimeloyl-ACP methyl ester carboxylesterase
MPKVTSKDGTIIAYDKKGQGPGLILVLGALNKKGSGKKLTELLVGDFTVISYDRRGRGDSTDTQPYSVEKEIDDIHALIDELGGTAYLYGHSSGAVLALLAAEKLGKKVPKMALYEVPHNDVAEAQKVSDT